MKLTETTNDKISNGTLSGGAVHVPVLPSFPLAPKKRGPKPKALQEQTVNEKPVLVAPYRKIAIIGTAPSSRNLAPYADTSWEIWACSAGNMNALPRVDCWFEIHANLLWPEHESWGKPYVEWLKAQPFPVFMQDNNLVPRAQRFPKEELVKEFGRYFFTSSFAWMMAFAIHVGANEIGLYGVDMASRDEYILQRSGGQFFIQEAKRRGIKVVIPLESDLIQPPALYGFDDSTNFMRKVLARKKEIRDRISAAETQIANLQNQVTYLKGAEEDIDYFQSIFGGVQSSGVIT